MNKRKEKGRCKDCAYQMTERCFYGKFWQDCCQGIRLKRDRDKKLKEAKKNDTRSKV